MEEGVEGEDGEGGDEGGLQEGSAGHSGLGEGQSFGVGS